MSTTLDENIDRIFNERDYKVFKWIFCRYVCLIGFGPTTDYTLFVNSGLRGYMCDEPMMKEYVLDNADNVYRVFINRVLKCLVDKGLFKKLNTTDGDTEYEGTDLLKQKCSQFKKYLMGDINII